MKCIWVFDDDADKLEEIAERIGISVASVMSDIMEDLDIEEFEASYE